jgi:hypothetical protein
MTQVLKIRRRTAAIPRQVVTILPLVVILRLAVAMEYPDLHQRTIWSGRS